MKTKIMISMMAVLILLAGIVNADTAQIHQEIPSVRGSTNYTLSMWIKTPLDVSVKVKITENYLESVDDAVPQETKVLTTYITQAADTDWEYHKTSIMTQPTTNNILLTLEVNGPPYKAAAFDELQFYETESKKVLNFQGIFYGCRITDSYYINLINTETNDNLKDNAADYPDAGYCRAVGTHFCSYADYWKKEPNPDADSTVASDAPPYLLANLTYFVINVSHILAPVQESEVLLKECCPENFCWTGGECVNTSEFDHPSEGPIFGLKDGYRCINGTWEFAKAKYDQFKETYGYCFEESECYFYNETDEQSSKCVPSEFFFKDHYCEGGNWTSRTKMVAMQLLQMVGPSDYTLFCDRFDKSLNEYDYVAPGSGGGTVKRAYEYIRGIGGTGAAGGLENCNLGPGVPCVNNICVLNYTDSGKKKVVIGFSFNMPLNDSAEFSPLNLFKEALDSNALNRYDYCDDAISSSRNSYQYSSCSGSSPATLWVNQKTMSLIYSNQSVTVGAPGAYATFKSLVFDPLQTILGILYQYITGTDYMGDYTFVKEWGVTDFRRLYMASKGTSIKIRGVSESIHQQIFTSIAYTGINQNICDIIYNSEIQLPITCPPGGAPTCKADGGVVHVESQDCDAFWEDATAKIRLQ